MPYVRSDHSAAPTLSGAMLKAAMPANAGTRSVRSRYSGHDAPGYPPFSLRGSIR